MELELITDMAAQKWDETIKAYDTKGLFHQSAWLRFLEETQNAGTLRFRITEGGVTVGYFAGLTVQKGPLKILGSPLPGWTTEFIGPVVNEGFDSGRFLDALDDKCRELGVHHVEICSPYLSRDLMRQKGYGAMDSCTYVVPLFKDEDTMWANLFSKCRQNIRAGIRNRLRVETCDDPSFVDEYYAELVEVFARQKLVPSYSVERVRSLFKALHPGNILALRVMNGKRVIATGIFPYDERCAYMFGAASWRSFQRLYPNELLYWTAMVLLAKRGVPTLDMCGDGNFKPKFGASMVPVHKYFKSYSFAARWGREAYRAAFRAKQSLSGRLSTFRPGAA